MKCHCGADTGVIDSRDVVGGKGIRRRRKCTAGHRFTTYEKVRRGGEMDMASLSTADLNDVRAMLDRALHRLGFGKRGTT